MAEFFLLSLLLCSRLLCSSAPPPRFSPPWQNSRTYHANITARSEHTTKTGIVVESDASCCSVGGGTVGAFVVAVGDSVGASVGA